MYNNIHFQLQFITVDHATLSHSEQAIRAYESGCKWVQLRMKKSSKNEIINEALTIIPHARKHNAIFLINDHVDIACKVNADGVHLGKMDMVPSQARKLIGSDKIIGGTANDLEDILRLKNEGVDYIGLGPFRFTSTKENLSPIIGLDGYTKIFNNLKKLDFHVPIVAIGGITNNDIMNILATGVSGVALAGEIVKNNTIEDNLKLLLSTINN